MALNMGIRIHQYLDDWLVRAKSHQDCLQHTQDLVRLCQRLGWLVNLEKSELEPKQIFDFVGYQFDLKAGRVRPTQDRWQHLQDKLLEILSLPAFPVQQFMSLIGLLTATEKQVHLGRLHMRPIQWHLKNNWQIPETLEKVIPIPSSLHPLTMVTRRRQRSLGPTVTPNKTCSATLYRCIKRRVGHLLKRIHCQRSLVTAGKQATHKLPRVKGGLPSLERFSRPLRQQHSSGSQRQHYSSVVHKQGRGYEVGPSMCPTMEDLDLVYQKTSDSQSPTYSGPVECGSRQAIPSRPDHSNRMVPPSRGLPDHMLQVAPAPDRPICNEIQQQVTSVHVTSTGYPGSSSGCSQSAMGGSGCICLPSSSHVKQSGGEVARLPVQENHSDCSGVAQHALVLGSSRYVQPNPTEPAQSARPVDTTLQSDPSQKSDKSKSPCMAARATAIKEQGFSEAVRTTIEAPQRGSTRSVYEVQWAIFTKWCITNQVDFRAPPVKSVADFLMYLFEDRKLQPSAIDGYQSAIADKLGNLPFNVSKDENLTRLLDSFHRDPRVGGEFLRGTYPWSYTS